jgi:hypothetical protein
VQYRGMPAPQQKTLEQILDAIRKADAQERMQSNEPKKSNGTAKMFTLAY